MTDGPPLEAGEKVVFDHVPSHRAFRLTALVLLGATLVPTLIFAYAFAGTAWVAVPLFVACVLLMQERVNLGRHRAWVTDRRIIRQGGEAVALSDISEVRPGGTGVRLRLASGKKGPTLSYPPDADALARAIRSAILTAKTANEAPHE